MDIQQVVDMAASSAEAGEISKGDEIEFGDDRQKTIFERLGIDQISDADKSELLEALLNEVGDKLAADDEEAASSDHIRMLLQLAQGGPSSLSEFRKSLDQKKIDAAIIEDGYASKHVPANGYAPCDSQINLRVPKSVKRELKVRAEDSEKSMSAYLIWCANVIGMAHGEEVSLRVAPQGNFLKRMAREAANKG